MMLEITSKDNKIIKFVASLLIKKYRDENKMFVVDSKKLIVDAINAGYIMQYLFILDEKEDEYIDIISKANIDKIFKIPMSILNKISDTITPQGIVGVFSINEVTKKIATTGRYIALENVSNPLNVGAIIRSANAFNLDGVIVDSISADVFSPKVIRGSMGSVFGIDIIKVQNISDIFSDENAKKYTFYCTAIDKNAIPLSNIEFTNKDIVIIGNEGSGATNLTKEMSSCNIYVEMNGTAQSLNASVAAGIICYQMKKLN